MKKSEHLPVYGIGPFYGVFVIAFSVAFFILSFTDLFSKGVIRSDWIVFLMIVLGLSVSVFGFCLWIPSAFGKTSIDCYIEQNKLCTTGNYRIVRNPCYSGITLIFVGFLLMAHNYFLIPLPFLYWGVMTLLLVCFEEKWLKKTYGQEYEDYCKNVNRCIPWFPKNKFY